MLKQRFCASTKPGGRQLKPTDAAIATMNVTHSCPDNNPTCQCQRSDEVCEIVLSEGTCTCCYDRIQEERKNIGLDVSDRITVNWNAPTELATAISSAISEISAEVLATDMVQVNSESASDNELSLWLKLVKN